MKVIVKEYASILVQEKPRTIFINYILNSLIIKKEYGLASNNRYAATKKDILGLIWLSKLKTY